MLSGCRKSALFLYFLLLLDGIFLHCHAGGLCQHYQFVVKEAPYTRLYKTKKILTVNGQFVGPTLHVHKGDEIVVGVYNRGNHNITLHWHGVKQPRCPWLDGPEYITQCPIKPGAKFSQKVIFTAEEGTIWWHAHSDWSRATVHGAIVVYPKYDTCYPFPKPSAEVPIILGTFYVLRRKKYEEIREDWEGEYGPHRFSYKDLFKATRGFADEELLGAGGFGKVYRGVLSSSNQQVAVKKVSHDSKQGMREFVAEIASMGRLRHRNLVQLLGYTRRKGELLLVYDYMPNGSLDKFLFGNEKPILNWAQRYCIIRGVASALLYLHEEWEQVVIHRDIKASNVLLDADLNGRLGDFGLARLYDHGANPETTHVVGTVGYLAPELTRTGKATTSTDVFSFGAFILEVACGRRPIQLQRSPKEVILVDWVFENWKEGAILETSDPRLGRDYLEDEMELVLKLGLLCSGSNAATRPNMRQVMQYLDGDVQFPEISHGTASMGIEASSKLFMSFPPSVMKSSDHSMSCTESIFNSGR